MSNFLQTRGMLAKLLAQENLLVEHDSTASTASFNTDTRVLKLPVLKTENENVYNMFVAHECAHALETPQHWKDDIPKGVSFDFVNVIEDGKIEGKVILPLYSKYLKKTESPVMRMMESVYNQGATPIEYIRR